MPEYTERDVAMALRGSELLNQKKAEIDRFVKMFVTPLDSAAIEHFGKRTENIASAPLKNSMGKYVGSFTIRTAKHGLNVDIQMLIHPRRFSRRFCLRNGAASLPRSVVLLVRDALPTILTELVKLFPELKDEVGFYANISREEL